MKKFLFLIVSLVLAISVSAQNWRKLPIPEADRDLICNLVRIMNLPEGTHKIYNGKGNTVFDVLYTIRCKKDEWTVYKGGTTSVFDALYTITLSDHERVRHSLFHRVRPRGDEDLQRRFVQRQPLVLLYAGLAEPRLAAAFRLLRVGDKHEKCRKI